MERPPHKRGPGRPSEGFPLAHRRLKYPEWPETDRTARDAACHVDGPLTPSWLAVSWALATATKRWAEWGGFLAYLQSVGELKEEETPAARLTPERLRPYIMSLRQRVSANSLRCEVIDLSYAAMALAPDRSWAWVRTHPLLPRPAEVRASRKPIDPPDPVALLSALLDQCEHANRLPPSPATSLQHRNGVLMAVAICTGLRRKNLAEMQIGEHVLIGDDHIRLLFTTSVKNRQVVDILVPPFLLPHLRAYLEKHRPILLQGTEDCQALWINLLGRPLEYTALRFVFTQTSTRLIGRSLTVHIVRHAMATRIMDRDPRDLEGASAALAHRGTSSVNEVYDRSGHRTAQRMWMRLLRNSRKRLRKGKPE